MEDLECQIKTNVSLKLLRQSVGEWEEKVELEGKLGKKRELRTFVKTGAAKHSQNSAVMGCLESRTREVTETLLCLEVGTNVHTLTY